MKQTYRQLERIMKGVANHHRLKTLNLLARKPGLSVLEIAGELNSNFKNISVHINKMHTAGLLVKKSSGNGNIVNHTLTARGKRLLKFVRIME